MIRTEGKKKLLLARIRNFLRIYISEEKLSISALSLKENLIRRLSFKRAKD
jgi:hypothetical protein